MKISAQSTKTSKNPVPAKPVRLQSVRPTEVVAGMPVFGLTLGPRKAA